MVFKVCLQLRYMDVFTCAGEAVQMRADAERQCAQAKEERSKLEEKLAQVERSTLLTLTSKQQIHREQLEAERQQKVHFEFAGLIVY